MTPDEIQSEMMDINQSYFCTALEERIERIYQLMKGEVEKTYLRIQHL